MALLLNINVQQGHPMSIGTDVDYSKLVKEPLQSGYSYSSTGLTIKNAAATDWKVKDDALISESYLLTPRGLKRIPPGRFRKAGHRQAGAVGQVQCGPRPQVWLFE